MAQTDFLQDYDGLICVSGDGMVNEVLNGLMQREDGCSWLGLDSLLTPLVVGSCSARMGALGLGLSLF